MADQPSQNIFSQVLAVLNESWMENHETCLDEILNDVEKEANNVGIFFANGTYEFRGQNIEDILKVQQTLKKHDEPASQGSPSTIFVPSGEQTSAAISGNQSMSMTSYNTLAKLGSPVELQPQQTAEDHTVHIPSPASLISNDISPTLHQTDADKNGQNLYNAENDDVNSGVSEQLNEANNDVDDDDDDDDDDSDDNADAKGVGSKITPKPIGAAVSEPVLQPKDRNECSHLGQSEIKSDSGTVKMTKQYDVICQVKSHNNINPACSEELSDNAAQMIAERSQEDKSTTDNGIHDSEPRQPSVESGAKPFTSGPKSSGYSSSTMSTSCTDSVHSSEFKVPAAICQTDHQKIVLYTRDDPNISEAASQLIPKQQSLSVLSVQVSSASAAVALKAMSERQTGQLSSAKNCSESRGCLDDGGHDGSFKHEAHQWSCKRHQQERSEPQTADKRSGDETRHRSDSENRDTSSTDMVDNFF
jgi:hypothetical protein